MSKLKAILKDNPHLKIAFLFFAACILLNVAFAYISHEGGLDFLAFFTAKTAAALIHVSGLAAALDGDMIYLANSVWKVNMECTAIMIMITFVSFVLVSPSPIKAKGLGLAIGVPFIFCANISRLFVMAWIDKLAPAYSTFFHDYLWEVAFIIMVILMWLVWIDKVVRREA
jgi:archaeosortase B (VPXXXP-CTERM-specific)